METKLANFLGQILAIPPYSGQLVPLLLSVGSCGVALVEKVEVVLAASDIPLVIRHASVEISHLGIAVELLSRRRLRCSSLHLRFGRRLLVTILMLDVHSSRAHNSINCAMSDRRSGSPDHTLHQHRPNSRPHPSGRLLLLLRRCRGATLLRWGRRASGGGGCGGAAGSEESPGGAAGRTGGAAAGHLPSMCGVLM